MEQKTYRFGMTHTETGYIDVKAESEEKAREMAEEIGCPEMVVHKCDFTIDELIEGGVEEEE